MWTSSCCTCAQDSVSFAAYPDMNLDKAADTGAPSRAPPKDRSSLDWLNKGYESGSGVIMEGEQPPKDAMEYVPNKRK